MTQPISVTVDQGAAYIKYRNATISATVDLVVTASVAVDVDREDRVVGIEILDVASADQVETARRYAAVNDLAFPEISNDTGTVIT